MIGYLDLTGLDTVNSESLNIIINFQTSGRAKCLFVADLGLFRKMGYRPRLSELYGRLHIRFSKAIVRVGAIGSQGYQDGQLTKAIVSVGAIQSQGYQHG